MAEGADRGDPPAPGAWVDTYRSLLPRPRDELSAGELEALAVAAYLHGDDETSVEAWEAAYTRHLVSDDAAEAARCSFWLALTSMLKGQMAHASGWLGRAQQAIGGDLECAAAGYLLIPALLGALESGDVDNACVLAEQANEIAVAFGDPDLAAFATLGRGQALIAGGDTGAGLAELDQVMLSVEGGQVGPIATGIVYCAVILECMDVLDLARASEWTNSLDAWCTAQPELVPYRGQCLVHQSQLHQAAGDWEQAAVAVGLARERLSHPLHPALGLAHYQEGELLRVRGALEAAADAYARASRAGHEPQPGLALLLLARGDPQAAEAGIRRALQETTRPLRRPPLLAAAVEIFRATGDREAASAAASELEQIAADATSEVIDAMAAEANGAVLLDAGDIPGALEALRAASGAWQSLSTPYQAARTGVLVGLACVALGDAATASLEFENASATFSSLGAAIDLAKLRPLAEGLGRDSPPEATGPGVALSPRELEVLRHVAEGKTSPEIAAELTISRHTVRRHLENIFAKLGVNTRAAATAHAYQHGLL